MAIQDIAWQIVGKYSLNLQNRERLIKSKLARAEKLFPKIEDFEVEVQYRYIFSLPTSPLYVPFPTGIWVASLAGKTQDGRHVSLWEIQYTGEKGSVIQGAMCAMLQELQKEKML